jgi:hypothetical protein
MKKIKYNEKNKIFNLLYSPLYLSYYTTNIFISKKITVMIIDDIIEIQKL